jgi:hypothetical protein
MAHALRHTLGQLGWRNAALYWLARALARVTRGCWRLHRYQFIAQHVADAPLNTARGHDIAIAPHDPNAALPAGYPRSAAVVAARVAQGARSLVAWRHERLAGFLWLIDHAYQEDEVRARFQLASPRAAWDFDVWVAPDQRLGMTFARLWEAARVQLRARDVRWTCSRISAFNPASLRAHAAIGVVPLGSALFLCCGSWQWMFASMAPRFHWSRAPDSYPVLTFDTRALPIPIKELS